MVKYPASTFQRGGLIIDSRSTLTSMPDAAYEPFMAAVKSHIRSKPVNEPANGYDLCYYSSQVVLSKFPRIAFHFAGNATFVVPPRNSFDPAEVNGLQLQCLGVRVKRPYLGIHSSRISTSFMIWARTYSPLLLPSVTICDVKKLMCSLQIDLSNIVLCNHVGNLISLFI